MFTGSRSTLLLFVWVFYIISGFLDLLSAFAYFSDGNPFVWSYLVTIPLDLFLLFGGIYFVRNIQTLLPGYLSELIRIVTTVFVVQIFLGLAYLPSTLSNPVEVNEAFSSNPLAWVLGLTFVGIAFNYLICLVVINSLKRAAGKDVVQSRKTTLMYWVILLAFFATMLIAIFWDSAANSFNVL